MSEHLLEKLGQDMNDDWADSEYIRDRFVEVGHEYVNETDDPTAETIEVLVEHFEDRDPDDMDEETVALLWSKYGFLRWMIDELPLQGQHRDPEWLRQRLNDPFIQILDKRSEDH